MAAAFYGMLRQDCWIEVGGSIENWLGEAAAAGRLNPNSIHNSAVRVLERADSELSPVQQRPVSPATRG